MTASQILSEHISVLQNIELVVFDFDGVFTDNNVYVSETGVEMVKCSRSDGLGLQRLREIKLAHFVLSTEENPVVRKRCEKLKIRCINGCQDKLHSLKLELKNLGDIDPSLVVFVGNDINDASVLKFVGFPVVVADAHFEVKSLAKYVTHNLGGKGAVREVCDLIYFTKEKGVMK